MTLGCSNVTAMHPVSLSAKIERDPTRDRADLPPHPPASTVNGAFQTHDGALGRSGSPGSGRRVGSSTPKGAVGAFGSPKNRTRSPAPPAAAGRRAAAGTHPADDTSLDPVKDALTGAPLLDHDRALRRIVLALRAVFRYATGEALESAERHPLVADPLRFPSRWPARKRSPRPRTHPALSVSSVNSSPAHDGRQPRTGRTRGGQARARARLLIAGAVSTSKPSCPASRGSPRATRSAGARPQDPSPAMRP